MSSSSAAAALEDPFELKPIQTLLDAKARTLFSNGKLLQLDANARSMLKSQLSQLVAPAKELESTLAAFHDNQSFQEMVDAFVAVDRKGSGIKSDEEEAAVQRFRHAVLVVLSTSERIEIKSGCTDIFRCVVVRAGDALLRYHQVYNESLGMQREETLTMRDARSFGSVAIGSTIELDNYNNRTAFAGWLKIESDAALRAVVGPAADGLSDDTLVQMVFGALSGQIDDLDAIGESVLKDATDFISGEKYTEEEEAAEEEDTDRDDGEDERPQSESGERKRQKT
jgi:hypothetical protein